MATYRDGNVRRATPNSVKAARRSAESRKCPQCQRKSAMKFHSDDFGFGSTCRWCGHSNYQMRDFSDPAPTTPNKEDGK